MRTGFIATYGKTDLASAPDDEVAVNTAYGTLLISASANPSHQDLYTFEFSSEPGNGDTTMFRVPHGFNYQPDGLAMIQFDDELGGGSFEGQFAILPLLQIGAGNTTFKYKITASYLEVYVTVSGGGALTLSGKSYVFKYIIFANSK